jgi:Ca-activated chloride channel homolog
VNFSYPVLLYFSILAIPLILYRYRSIVFQSLKYSPIQHSKPSRSYVRIYLLLLIETLLFLSIIFLASDPYDTKERSLIQDTGVDIALVLDVSASMQADDFEPNRLEYMKDVSKKFIQRSSGHRIGVYIFAQEAFTQTPLTFDYSTLLELIDSIHYNVIDHSLGGGTAIGDALLSAAEGLLKSKLENRDQAIILITDGENSDGTDPELAAKYISSKNIYLFIIGMAGEEPVPVFVNKAPFITPSGKQLVTSLDDTSLQSIAKSGRGTYFRAKTETGLNEILTNISNLSKTPIEVDKIITKISFAHKYTWIPFILFIGWIFVFGILVRRPIK